jgi:hypothetical protein
MYSNFDQVAETAMAWAARHDLPAPHREIARTVSHMAVRFGNEPVPSMVADKALKVVGCHLCRLMGEAICSAANSTGGICPLGFRSAGKQADSEPAL